jgi:predicted CXXCH cytochrome family protein
MRACRRIAAALAIVGAIVLVAFALRPVSASEAVTASPPLNNPDAVCASCHRAIYERYEQTPMARGSGVATDALQAGAMHHGPSGVDYRVFLRDGSAWMSFARSAPSLEGERQLEYFIGSGRRGRTYLYAEDGQWFELPINFYTRRGAWGMAPAFDEAKTMPAALPVDPNCLHCHATEVGASLPTARNRFVGQPFRQGGIGCNACHGDPAEHLAKHGHGGILNPDRLDAARRDSVCTQCHLEGETVVYRAGRSLAQFRPGDDLSNTAVYFVRAGRGVGEERATSQYEALLRSACKRGSGDRLTCTSCHDPHASPGAGERVQYFRARCLACHTGVRMATEHHPEQPDCAACHMPTRDTSDISHEQVTDHDIEAIGTIEARPERAGSAQARPSRGGAAEELVAVGGVRASEAEYGMAYAQLATRGGAFYRQEALQRLIHAAEVGTLEPAIEAQLGYLLQVRGQAEAARTAYAAALRQDPYQPTALGNLGVLEAASGQVAEAVRLLGRLVEADPSQTPAGLNLAWIECQLGERAEARQVLERLRRINPDDPQLRMFEGSGDYLGRHCELTDTAGN